LTAAAAGFIDSGLSCAVTAGERTDGAGAERGRRAAADRARPGRADDGLSDRACKRLACGLIGLSVAFHLVYLAVNCPLDLSPDEAHYWQWSRHLAWSYYSKGRWSRGSFGCRASSSAR
jgi:hypothetical protein